MPIAISQRPSYCGPTSLSSCMFLMGIDADPKDLVKTAGHRLKIFLHGMDERQIRRAAGRFGVRCRFIMETREDKGAVFAARLRRHLQADLPAILLVKDFEHWVAVVGFLDDRFVVMDPNDHHRAYNRWNEHHLLRRGWNEIKDRDPEKKLEPDQYFAILLSRKDREPPRYRFTRSLMKMDEVGPMRDHDEIFKDLVEIARRASGRSLRRIRSGSGRLLADVLVDHEETVITTINHWISDRILKVDPADIRSLYRDYVAIAGATGIRLPAGSDYAELLAQITVLMTVYGCVGTL